MQVFEDQKAKEGMAEKLVLKCSNCTNKIDFFTSEVKATEVSNHLMSM